MTLNQEEQALEITSEKENYQISLLEEKIQIARRKQKVGEVIIRKEVEQKIVTLPIRREKLVIEKIGKNPEKLTEVVLSEDKLNGFGYDELNNSNALEIHKSNFISLAKARELLLAIDQFNLTNGSKIRLEIASISGENSNKIKEICDRFQN